MGRRSHDHHHGHETFAQVANGASDLNLKELVDPSLWAATKMISCYTYTSIINKSSLCRKISKQLSWWTIRDSQQFCPIWIKDRTCGSAASLFFTQTLVSNPRISEDSSHRLCRREGGGQVPIDNILLGTEQVGSNRNAKCGTIHKATSGYSR